MFVGDEVLLDVSFKAARARLAKLTRDGSLVSASTDAYGEGITHLVGVGPPGAAPGMSRLVEVLFLDLVLHEDCAVLALRWEAVGPGGELFAALDADISLLPAGEQTALFSLAGAYRPPLGAPGAWLDRAILQRVAAVTIRTFINRVADAIAHPASAAERTQGQAGADRSWLPPAFETP